MPPGAWIPEEVLKLVAAAIIFAVMFDLGLGIVLAEFRWVWRNPGRVAKGLFAVLVAVPAIALVVVRAFDLPRSADVGIVLMAISPGAPVALRRSLDAGGHRSFAPALQILVALFAVVSMPLSIAALDILYQGSASVSPVHIAQQVFLAQLLPLGLGMLLRRSWPALAIRLETKLTKVAAAALIALTVLVLANVWRTVADAGPRIVLAIATVTVLAMLAGYGLGGPDGETRTAVAVSAALRNPGLALLVATLNAAAPGVGATIFAYVVVSGLIVVAFVAARRRRGAGHGTATSSTDSRRVTLPEP
jgi:BASS family bile acid:Na+ symporter